MIEQKMTVPVRIPPMVRDRTVIKVPIEGLGVSELFLAPPYSNCRLTGRCRYRAMSAATEA